MSVGQWYLLCEAAPKGLYYSGVEDDVLCGRCKLCHSAFFAFDSYERIEGAQYRLFDSEW